jgi:hypothetical protein
MRPFVILLAGFVIGAGLTLLHSVSHGRSLPSRNEVYATPNAPGGLQETKTPQTANSDAAPIMFDWNASPNQIIPWLKKNKRLLNRGDGCTLAVHWASADPKQRSSPTSSVHEIASLVVAPADEEIHTIIRDKVSGSWSDVRVGVQYLPGKSGVWELRIALAFDGPPEDVFHEVSRAEGATLRDQEWKSLTVVKPIRISEFVYTYALSCENGRTFLSFLRQPVKTHAPIIAKPQ